MQKWNLVRGDPLSLTLACDARLEPGPDYANDQIWELVLAGGEPPAAAFETTYGLRARQMRIFPRFVEGSQAVTDPLTFPQPIQIQEFYPNYLQYSFSPFIGIDVLAEAWVPSSQTLTARFQITNSSIVPRQIRLDWAALLTPFGNGEGMSPAVMGVTPVLRGSLGEGGSDLEPVFFMTGGPEAGSSPYPALSLDLDLMPGTTRQFTWALASLDTAAASFELARQTTARRWEAELARIQALHAAQVVEIYTGDPGWNAAFAASQKVAYGLLIGSAQLPNLSFIQARLPDKGYSSRGDGGDYPPLWSGQTALDSLYLTGLLLPGAASIARGLLCNFLAVQAEDGSIDWKPGLAGQRGFLLAQPFLASLAWQIYEADRDTAFLQMVFPALERYVEVWLRADHDQDHDDFPEWDHPVQTGLEENPLFDRWHPNGKGLDISTVEDPALAACLSRECACLSRMAVLIEKEETAEKWSAQQGILRKLVEDTWDPRRSLYRFRDRHGHDWPRGKILARGNGTAVLQVKEKFSSPARLQIQVISTGQTTRSPAVHLYGQNGTNPVEEHIPSRALIWIHGQASLTSQHLYSQVDRVEVEGLTRQDKILLSSAGYAQEAITCLLPLWASIPDPRRAARMVEKTILNPERFGLGFGLPSFPVGSDDSPAPSVHPLWNSFIIKGLLDYGYLKEAVDLYSRLMACILNTLKTEGRFRKAYHAVSGEGLGEGNSLQGLAPAGLFLEILGVRFLPGGQVILRGQNPFPWPVTVRFRGMSVVRREQDTWITFPDGQMTRFTGTNTHLVSLT